MAKRKRAFVTGYPVKHSCSPMIHGHWLRQYGLEGSYEMAEVAPDDFTRFIEDLIAGRSGFVGGNVTIPHKEAAFALAQGPDEIARELAAANTLWLEDGRLCASNTDGYGFAANLDAQAPGWSDGETAVVLGAGGASRAIIMTLRDRSFREIRVVNRTVERAIALAERFGERISAHPLDALLQAMHDATLFVNTSSLGMGGSDVPAIDFSQLETGAIVTDIVYTPLVTPILAMAREQGFPIVDGLGMLLHQAVSGFEKWFGVRPTVDDSLRALIVADLENH